MTEPKELFRITVNLQDKDQALNLPGGLSMEAVMQAMYNAADSDTSFKDKLSKARQCTSVYHACGSCVDNMMNRRGYLIQYFCDDGNGTSQPDGSTCMPC